MSMQLSEINQRLAQAKEQHGRLKQIAVASKVSYRTIYSIMKGNTPSVATSDKLSDFFKAADRKAKKEQTS